MNAPGHQGSIDIQYIVAQGFCIITDCFTETVMIVFLDHFNASGCFAIDNFRPKDNAYIVQTYP